MERAMSRRRFDHLLTEVSVAAGSRIPRYDLWLRIHEAGSDPEDLTSWATVAFCDGPLTGFLAERGLQLSPTAKRRLRRAVKRYNPDLPSPEEVLFGTS
jgi:hypothetical protein